MSHFMLRRAAARQAKRLEMFDFHLQLTATWPARFMGPAPLSSHWIFGRMLWYSWAGSNRRPSEPQSDALTN